MTFTLPAYLLGGWSVLAHPDGSLLVGNTIFDYLYYEAQVPDTAFREPSTGYVIEQDKLASFLPEMVMKLGLNDKETKQFVQYWSGVLPSSPYYFVGVLPQTTLDNLAPLTITPKPDSVLRVSLYFKALEKKIEVTPPVILPFQREGFSVVEWGGLVKRDKNHPFTCFM
jgi:hypothetical protein